MYRDGACIARYSSHGSPPGWRTMNTVPLFIGARESASLASTSKGIDTAIHEMTDPMGIEVPADIKKTDERLNLSWGTPLMRITAVDRPGLKQGIKLGL